eukprot:824190-Pleurochrysis_carterae.AAC.1
MRTRARAHACTRTRICTSACAYLACTHSWTQSYARASLRTRIAHDAQSALSRRCKTKGARIRVCTLGAPRYARAHA